jgi:hypothetical protein
MTRGLDKRVRDLETSTGGQVCGECGDGGGDPASWEVVWVDLEEPAEPKWCGTCGRPLEIVVTWDDIPDRRGLLPPGAA